MVNFSVSAVGSNTTFMVESSPLFKIQVSYVLPRLVSTNFSQGETWMSITLPDDGVLGHILYFTDSQCFSSTATTVFSFESSSTAVIDSSPCPFSCSLPSSLPCPLPCPLSCPLTDIIKSSASNVSFMM